MYMKNRCKQHFWFFVPAFLKSCLVMFYHRQPFLDPLGLCMCPYGLKSIQTCVYVSDFASGHNNPPTVLKIDMHVPLDDI